MHHVRLRRALTSGLLAAMSFCVAALWAPEEASALPRMSLTAGSPCATCHVSPSGGGMRNELGFTSMNKTGTLDFGDMGLHALHHQDTNQIAGLVSLGADIRYQGVRLGIPTAGPDGEVVTPDFEMFQMQMQPYLALHPFSWMTLSGSYSFGEDVWDGGEACQDTWPGMSCYTAEAVITPDPELPMIRAGMITPSIGIRHDDHTILTRSHGLRQPLVPSNYAELGGEVAYQPASWLRVEGGVFNKDNLDKLLNGATQTAELGDVAWQGRVQWLPQTRLTFGGEAPGGDDDFDDFDDFDAEPVMPTTMTLNGWLGASMYGSGEYRLEHYFAGAGSDVGASLQVEYSRSTRTSSPAPGMELEITTSALSTMLSYAFWEWLVLNGRVEMGDAEFNGNTRQTRQYVAGLEWFPIPFVEVRPEYRLVDTDDYKFGQATVQIHVFY